MRVQKNPNGTFYYYEGDFLQSVWPPQILFNFGSWSSMIPPYPPENCLILGYGEGTVAGLIRLVWGEMPITGIDVSKPLNEHKASFIDRDFMQADAFEYIKTTLQSFDYVVIDLFNGKEMPSKVATDEFAFRLSCITKTLLCINVWEEHEKKVAEIFGKFFVPEVVRRVSGTSIMFFRVKSLKLENESPILKPR